MFRKIISDNPQRKARLDQKFIGILVKDYQPLSIREDEEFLEFIYELDPLYQLPSEKRILELLTNRYNNVKDILVNKIDKQAKKDGKQLKGINFTKDEWNAISELIPILELFANATELLGVEVVDFTEPNTTFDDDVEYEDSEDGDIANNQSKQRKIKINTPQDCKNLILKVKSALYESITYYWNISEDYRLIATLLDPCCKSLFFVSPELHSNIHLKLRSIYNEIKLEYSKQEKDCYEEYLTNSLLASMFSRRYERGDEITEYLRVEEIVRHTSLSPSTFKHLLFLK
ncbi:19306_t:CDS:2 [Rhizophagus irregularis]|nr:19306_t:CDS:2 [Rhizophagus irregularis]